MCGNVVNAETFASVYLRVYETLSKLRLLLVIIVCDFQIIAITF